MKQICIVFLLVQLCCACICSAADPLSFQSYFNSKSEATTINQNSDFIPIIQNSLTRKVRPASLFNGWQSVPYLSTNFTADPSGTWTVSADDVVTLTYVLQGKTMTVSWVISGTAVSGNPTRLRIRIPENKVSNRLVFGLCDGADNGSVTSCSVQMVPGQPYIHLLRGLSTPNWNTSTGDTVVLGQITFEVQ